MTATASSFAALVTPFFGRTVISTDKTGAESRFTIVKLADKIGTMKDGTKAEYVVLVNSADVGVMLNLHPQHAKRLLTKGEDSGLVMAMDLNYIAPETAAEPVVETAPETVVNTAPETAEETAAEPVVETAAEPVVETAAEPVAKVSKKSLCVVMFTEMTTAGKPRKEIIARMMAELQLSVPGANTYYQNCKSGAWTV
jgi:hypothetical protein